MPRLKTECPISNEADVSRLLGVSVVVTFLNVCFGMAFHFTSPVMCAPSWLAGGSHGSGCMRARTLDSRQLRELVASDAD